MISIRGAVQTRALSMHRQRRESTSLAARRDPERARGPILKHSKDEIDHLIMGLTAGTAGQKCISSRYQLAGDRTSPRTPINENKEKEPTPGGRGNSAKACR
jgi:hypothetical protein